MSSICNFTPLAFFSPFIVAGTLAVKYWSGLQQFHPAVLYRKGNYIFPGATSDRLNDHSMQHNNVSLKSAGEGEPCTAVMLCLLWQLYSSLMTARTQPSRGP